MDKKNIPFELVDWLLLSAIACLSGFLLWEVSEPAVCAWQNRPRPGVQVCRQFVAKENGETDSANPAFQLDYLLFLPREYRRDGKWPLVIFLHGAGERGRDLEVVRKIGLPKQISLGDASPVGTAVLNSFILASPQCPANCGWEPERIMGLIEHLGKEFAVDPDRIYLTGFSMGGCGTWATACQYPERFAAIAPLAGGGDPTAAETLKDMLIRAFHGAEDETVPLESSRKMVEAVRQCGGRVEFTVYPGAGHGICDMTYENPHFYEWLLAKRRHPSR